MRETGGARRIERWMCEDEGLAAGAVSSPQVWSGLFKLEKQLAVG